MQNYNSLLENPRMVILSLNLFLTFQENQANFSYKILPF